MVQGLERFRDHFADYRDAYLLIGGTACDLAMSADNLLLLDRLKDPAEREWYARATIEHGWSRVTLDYQLESGLYHRQGAAVTNFEETTIIVRRPLAA